MTSVRKNALIFGFTGVYEFTRVYAFNIFTT